MIWLPSSEDQWRLLTEKNIATRRLWPWGYSIQKILATLDPGPFGGEHLLITSDYGGEHRASTHLIYSYLAVALTGDWLAAMTEIRSKFLTDGRRMAFKRLGDKARQRALIPFLAAGANLNGHLVCIAVDKQKKWLSTQPGSSDDMADLLGLKSFWNARTFESLMRKTHFVALMTSMWAKPYSNVRWITDQDEFVANEDRHDDALAVVGRLSSMYLAHGMREFALNIVNQDPEATDYEDLCAIPDLAAGMLSEVSSRLAEDGPWGHRLRKVIESEVLSPKADLICDWFWDTDMPLRKTLITIDLEGDQFAVRKVSQLADIPFDLVQSNL